MKTILAIAAVAMGLAATGAAIAQTETTTPATPGAVEDWNPFSRSSVRVYMTDVNDFRTSGDVVRARIARVPLDGQPEDYSYTLDEVELRCAAKQSRTVASIQYGPDGVQTDRYDEPEDWAAYAAESRDGYLSQLACDGDRVNPPTWPSIKAFVDAGRH